MFDGHCAFVGSCILQQAPAAELHVRPVLDSENDGSAWDAAIAMAEVARTGVDVVNLSFGEIRTDDDSAPMVLETAVKRFGPETVVVAAAGNNGDSQEPSARAGARRPRTELGVVSGRAGRRHRGRRTRSKRAACGVHSASRALDRAAAPGVGLTGAYVRGVVTIEHKDKNGKILDVEAGIFPRDRHLGGVLLRRRVVSGAIAAAPCQGTDPPARRWTSCFIPIRANPAATSSPTA